jgi:hypothetical protein
MINELLFEVVRTLPPVLLEVHCQVACHDHPSPVRHEPCFIHLSHQSINQRHPRLALSPPADSLTISLPLVVLPVINAILREDLIGVLHAPIPVKVSPEQFIDEDLGSFTG